MTAIITFTPLAFNEIHVLADTRVTYKYPNGTIDYDNTFGLQKLIPIVMSARHSIGVIGFSGDLAPIQVIVHHLINVKKITDYVADKSVTQVAEVLRGFIQEAYNQMPASYKKLNFTFLFAAIDTGHKSIFLDDAGNIVDNPLVHPIYLSNVYTFSRNTKNKKSRDVIQATPNRESFTIIGSGSVIYNELTGRNDNDDNSDNEDSEDKNLNSLMRFGKPYDGHPEFRSFLLGEIASDLIVNKGVLSVGSPYLACYILDPSRYDRYSGCIWQWGVDTDSSGRTEWKYDNANRRYIVTNTETHEKRIILHILDWPKTRIAGAMI